MGAPRSCRGRRRSREDGWGLLVTQRLDGAWAAALPLAAGAPTVPMDAGEAVRLGAVVLLSLLLALLTDAVGRASSRRLPP